MAGISLSTLFWGTLSAGGGGAVVALAVIRAFGSKWLDSKFDARLESLRHEHQRQMEDVRLAASRILDRSVRLTEREFEVSAEAWSRVFEVYVRTMSAMPGFRRYPDFSRATDEVVRRVAEGGDLDEFETAELLKKAPNERNKYYSDRRQAHEIWDAKKAVQDASNYLAKKALFLEQDVHTCLTQFVDKAWTAIVDRELVLEMRGEGPIPKDIRRGDEEFKKTAEAKIKELEQFVRQRFWNRDA